MGEIEYRQGDFEEEHDCFSDLSHVAVYYNFQALRNAFYGSYTALDGTVISGASLASYIKSLDSAIYTQIANILDDTQVQMQIVFDAGENGTSFDQIIAESKVYYEARKNGTPALPTKSAALIAVEDAILQLASIENIIIDLAEALSLTAVDGDAIGETD